MNQFQKRKAQARERWMRIAEAEALRIKPELAGKIDWETAGFLYACNFDPYTAGARLTRLPYPPGGRLDYQLSQYPDTDNS